MAKSNSEFQKNETWYPFRSLDNYKATHAALAKSKGKYELLMAAPTLTAARRIVFGK